MKLKGTVLGNFEETFKAKSGPKTINMVSILDGEVPAFRNTFDYVLTEAELDKYGETLVGSSITMDITSGKQDFTGRLRFSGVITGVTGLQTPKTK